MTGVRAGSVRVPSANSQKRTSGSRQPAGPPPAACFVVVAFNSNQSVEEFLRSLVEQTVPTWACVVVDNGVEEDASTVVDSFADQRVGYMKTPSNLGYFPAADYALSNYPEAWFGSSDWIVVSNQDVVLQSDFVREMVALDLGKTHPREVIRCLAPTVVDAGTGEDMNPYMLKRPSVLKQLGIAVMASFAGTSSLLDNLRARRTTGRLRRASDSSSAAGEIYAGHGSLLCLSQGFFRRSGHVGHKRGLYGEEVFVGEQILALSGRTTYEPRLRAIHVSHTSTATGSAFVRRELRVACWGIVWTLVRLRAVSAPRRLASRLKKIGGDSTAEW